MCIRDRDSRGLMQINVNAHPQYSGLDLFDPQINTSIAFQIYQQAGRSFQPWTCATILGLTDPIDNYLIAGVVFFSGVLYYSLTRI